MTGPEHYREAERLLTELDTVDAQDVGGVLAAATVRGEMIGRAQAHATLALAAASVVGPITASGRFVATDGMNQWQQAAGLEVRR